MNYWDELAHHTDVESIWMAHPDVRAAINRRVTGDPHVWPLFRLKRWLGTRAPIGRCVSIGCGTGGLERSLVGEGIARDVVGIDSSEKVIDEARRLAGSHIDYVLADARDYLRGKMFDAVFLHQSLHHFDRLDELLALVKRAINPGGFLYVDEYVGPSRDEWSWWKLLQPNLAYYSVPRSARRPHLVRAPINREDLTEAIRSSEIVAAVQRHFTIADRADYGGNLLAIVYPNLQRGKGFDRAVRRLIVAEERMLARGTKSFYTVIVGQ